jgi:NADPH:quinone reductase-like Zn-dependent oxidoreductase
VAGRIVQTIAGGPAVGSRVLALADWEGWAERVAVPLENTALLPDSVSTTIAAALPLAGITALRLLRAAGPLAGSRVLLTGASGGVGHLITELAAAAGAEVVVVTASAERAEQLIKRGAAIGVRSVEEAPGRFDIVLESVGGASLPAAAGLAKAETGVVLWFGQASQQPSEMDLFAFLGGAAGIRIVPFSYYRTAFARPDDLVTLVRLVSQDRLHVEIGREEDWQHTAAVLADLSGRRIRGKAVLHVT